MMKHHHFLGQHFLVSNKILQIIIDASDITPHDIIFEIGTGTGILLPLLCKKAKKVISVELDQKLYDIAKNKFAHIKNLTLKNHNGFESHYNFTIFVSNLPYSQSRLAMEWLVQQEFSHAIIMVQKEFANKLTAIGKHRKAVSILTNYAFEIQHITNVHRSNFLPMPNVDSVLLKLIKKSTIKKNTIRTINKLFSYRRKIISNIFSQFNKSSDSNKKRLDDLNCNELIDLAQKINS